VQADGLLKSVFGLFFRKEAENVKEEKIFGELISGFFPEIGLKTEIKKTVGCARRTTSANKS